jgi:hypothetical protein
MSASRDLATPWLSEARRYYSHIGGASADPVTVFDVTDNEEVSSEQPGTPCLFLEPRSGSVHIRDVDNRERGIIRAEGMVPGRKYAMRDAP